MEELLDQYDIIPCIANNLKDSSKTALGIGDLLFTINLLQKKVIEAPIYVNLNYFKNNTYPNPLNALKFRIQLINYICKTNAIGSESFVFIYDNNMNLNQHANELVHLTDLRLDCDWINIPTEVQLINEKYIIFHTKCRFLQGYNYESLKSSLKLLFNNYRAKFAIVLLGERMFPETTETRLHGITTIYQELLLLNNHNKVIDLTKDTIYNNLDFDEYLFDMKIINSAKYNVCIGCGGQFCNTLFYGDNTLVLWDNSLDIYRLNKKLPNLTMCYDVATFANKLNML